MYDESLITNLFKRVALQPDEYISNDCKTVRFNYISANTRPDTWLIWISSVYIQSCSREWAHTVTVVMTSCSL